tara:strand:+ start:1067 stop:1309 length:243 start_codon:yes stop_codon:yes gene_type:complete
MFNKYILNPDSDEYKSRKALCDGCEFYSNLKICAKCHCFMPMKMVLTWCSCNIGKWLATMEEPIDPETGAHYTDPKHYEE